MTNTPDAAHPDTWARIVWDSKGGLNFLGFKDPKIDTLLDNGTATSKYSKKLRIRANGVYRVVVQSVDQDHDDGTSRTRTLRVH